MDEAEKRKATEAQQAVALQQQQAGPSTSTATFLTPASHMASHLPHTCTSAGTRASTRASHVCLAPYLSQVEDARRRAEKTAAAKLRAEAKAVGKEERERVQVWPGMRGRVERSRTH